MRIALGLEYDGNGFCGWQTQAGGCAVQDHIESALARFSSERVNTITAGRTDAGVHAVAQVVHFDTTVAREESSWVRGTNAHLDDRIRILWARQVDDEFHARFSARSRTYEYLLINDGIDGGLWKGRAGWFHLPLDADQMHGAVQAVVGEHDFSAFRATECQAKSPVRVVTAASVTRDGLLLRFRFTANAFLHHMVRNMVGSLVYVGCGKKPETWMGDLLMLRKRALAAPTFSAAGLYLAQIEYDGRWGLPEFPARMAMLI